MTGVSLLAAAPWQQFYEAAPNMLSLPNLGSDGGSAVLDLGNGGGQGYVWSTTGHPWPCAIHHSGYTTRMLVDRNEPAYRGPLTVAALVYGRTGATIIGQNNNSYPATMVRKGDGVAGWQTHVDGVLNTVHPELRDRWSLVVAVVDGPRSMLSENGNERFYSGPATAALNQAFALMGVVTLHSNHHVQAWRWVGLYQGALTVDQRHALYQWAADEGVAMGQPVSDGSPTEAQAKLNATPDGGVVDLADKVYVQEVPLVVHGRHDLTILGPRLQAFTSGAQEPIPQHVHPFAWPRSRSHILVSDSGRVTLVRPDITGPNPHPLYKPAYESQAGILVADTARSVRILQPTITNVYGDGLELWGDDLTVHQPTIRTVGRQGISINHSDGGTIIGGTIRNTGRSGIDIEPYTTTWRTKNWLIAGVDVADCTNLPLTLGGSGPIDQVDIVDCEFDTAWIGLRGSNIRYLRNRAGFGRATGSDLCVVARGGVRMVDNQINVAGPTTVALRLQEGATSVRHWTNGVLVS